MLNDCVPQSFNDNICYLFVMAFATAVTVRDHRMRLARVLSLYGSASICIRLRRQRSVRSRGLKNRSRLWGVQLRDRIF